MKDTRIIQELIKEHINLNKKYDGEILEFEKEDGYDVYNCSIPFVFENETYIFGRVERRELWASSYTRLFKLDKTTGVFMATDSTYPLEDPSISYIDDEMILIGTYVIKDGSKIVTYNNRFYRGYDPFNLKHFADGPDYMKDIRILKLSSGKIGIFSRPRNDEVTKCYGTVSQIGYTEVDSLEDITPEAIENAKLIPNLFANMEWGGVNECFELKNNLIGIIGHHSYSEYINDVDHPVYTNVSYVYDSKNNTYLDKKVIGIKEDYGKVDAKLDQLDRVAFTSGIVPIGNNKVRLYSGLCDSSEGYIVIDDPFINYR